MMHDWDPETRFCRRCGVGEADDHELPRSCRDDVIAISHLVARRRTDDLVSLICERAAAIAKSWDDPNT